MDAASIPQARYDEWADWYEGYITGAAQSFTQRTAEILTQVLGPGTGPVLDLACQALSPAEIIITPGYWHRDRRFEAWSPRGVRAKVGARHVPLGELLETFVRAGLTIERVIEAGSPTSDLLAVRCIRTG
jgi:hypothetical protein